MHKDFDIVIPNNNEEEFIEMALRLNYNRIVFLSSDINYNYKNTPDGSNDKIIIEKAHIISNPMNINLARKRFDYILGNAERKYFEAKIDYVLGCEFSERKDSFHYRATSLNHVHAKLCRQNNISVIYNFSTLLDASQGRRAMFLGRMKQNMHLTRKYGLAHAAFSLAKIPRDMKSRSILDAFLRVLQFSKK